MANPFDQFDAAPSQQPASGPRMVIAPQLPIQRPEDQQSTILRNTRTTQEINNNSLDVASKKTSIDTARNNQALSIAQDYNQNPEVKAYNAALATYSSALHSPPTPQGDLSLVYAYAKVMDPNSAVREGEVSTAAGTQPIIQQIQAQFGKQVLEGGTFTPEARLQLRQALQSKMAELNRAYIAQRVRYKDQATRAGLNPLDVVGEHTGIPFQSVEAAFQGHPVHQADYRGNVIPDQVQQSPRVGNDYQGGNQIAPQGSTQQQIPIPEAMQAKYNAWLDQHGRGFDPQDYAMMRMQLDRENGFGVDPDTFSKYLAEGKRISDPSTNVNRTIPGVTAPLGEAGQAANNLIQTPGGTALANYANQAVVGVPQAIAGQEGFDAMSSINDRNPKAALLGGMVGGLTGAKGIGMGTQAAAQGMGLGADAVRMLQNPVTQNALAGGAVGFNTAPQGQGIPNALLGAGSAALLTKAIPVAGNALARSRPVQAASNWIARRGAPLPEAPAIAAAGQAENVPVTRPMVDPSVQNRVTGTEATIAGGPIVRNALNKTSSAIASRVNDLGNGGTAMVPEVAGDTVRKGATDFIKKSGKAADRAYRAAEARAGDVKIQPQEAGQEIGAIITRLSETPNANNAEIAYLKGLEQDVGKGLSVGALRDLRTTLRQKISKGELTFGQNEARVLGIMDAISRDLESGLTAAGKADAAKLFAQADRAYRDRMDFIQTTVQKMVGKRNANLTSEQVFKNFQAMATPKGDSQGLARFMQQLDPAERNDIAATFADGLGKNGKGQFSTALFMSQVQKLPRSARQTIFGQQGAESIENLLTLSKAHDRVFSQLNHSKSGVATTSARDYRSWLSGAIGLGTGVGTGNMMTGLAVAGTAAGAATLKDAISAKLLMTPSISKWIATAPATTSPAAINAHFNKLTAIAAREPAISGEIQTLQQRLIDAAKGMSGPTPAEDKQNPR